MKPIDNLQLTSIDEYNRIMISKIKERLAVDYTKRLGSRTSIFLEEEKDNLLPLPVSGYQSVTEKTAVVGRDFHIQYSKAFYSVPVEYTKEKVTVKDFGGRLRIYSLKGELIAEHNKAIRTWEHVTAPEHIPAKYGAYESYSPEYFITWAQKIGPETAAWVKFVLDCAGDSPVRVFNSLSTALHKTTSFDKDVVEQAAAHSKAANIKSAKGFTIVLTQLQNEKDMSGMEPEEIDYDDFYAKH